MVRHMATEIGNGVIAVYKHLTYRNETRRGAGAYRPKGDGKVRDLYPQIGTRHAVSLHSKGLFSDQRLARRSSRIYSLLSKLTFVKAIHYFCKVED
jgi:hypothetical protein